MTTQQKTGRKVLTQRAEYSLGKLVAFLSLDITLVSCLLQCGPQLDLDLDIDGLAVNLCDQCCGVLADEAAAPEGGGLNGVLQQTAGLLPSCASSEAAGDFGTVDLHGAVLAHTATSLEVAYLNLLVADFERTWITGHTVLRSFSPQA